MFWVFYEIATHKSRKMIRTAENRFTESINALYAAEKTNGGLRNHRNKAV
jgi:hypothetical protein